MSEPFLNPQHRLLRRTVRAFCEHELRPIAAGIDQEARFPWEVVEKRDRKGRLLIYRLPILNDLLFPSPCPENPYKIFRYGTIIDGIQACFYRRYGTNA